MARTSTRFKLLLLLCVVAIIAIPATIAAYQKAPTYTITVTTEKPQQFFFPDNGSFTAAEDGYYLLQVWGGDGGHGYAVTALLRDYYRAAGGDGGYVYGYARLEQNDSLSVVVGGAGETAEFGDGNGTAGGTAGFGTPGNGSSSLLTGQSGGGGGSGSAVTNTGGTPLIIAGGGGGGAGKSLTARNAGKGGSGGLQDSLQSLTAGGLYAPGANGQWMENERDESERTGGGGGSSDPWNQGGLYGAGNTLLTRGKSGGTRGGYSSESRGGNAAGTGGGGGAGWYGGGGGGAAGGTGTWFPGGGGGGSSYLSSDITRDDSALAPSLRSPSDAPSGLERVLTWSTSGSPSGAARYNGYVIITYLGTTAP